MDQQVYFLCNYYNRYLIQFSSVKEVQYIRSHLSNFGQIFANHYNFILFSDKKWELKIFKLSKKIQKAKSRPENRQSVNTAKLLTW